MASAEEPLYLTVGTDVSAKYRGAFCEAKIKKVQRMVKCRVTFKNNQGTHLVPDDHIRGALRIGAHVEAKHPDKSQFLDAVIGKLLDYSQYTVVFDDGDETTLRRTSLCLKSGRHFAESETLDQLPLTNPEHFGTPVMGSKAKRKRRSAAAANLPLEEDSSEEESVSPPQRGRGGSSSWPLATVGRVVCLEADRRKKDSWLPALVVSPGQEGIHTSRDECLVRSFKDGKYFQVPKRHLRQFTRDLVPQRVENGTLKVALERAQAYLEKGELPPHWDTQLLLGGDAVTKDDDEDEDDDGADDVSDDEPSEEKDRFVAQLYKFMDERGTPINKGPTINGQDLNLYRLFRLVGQLGGGNKVSNQSQWRRVYSRLALPPPANQANAQLLRNSYKKYLQSFEDFYRKLGCTMESHPRGGISGRASGRSPRHHRVLTRNQDRGLAFFAPPPVKEKKEVPVKDEDSTVASTKEESGRSSGKVADDTKARRTREKNSSDSGATTRRSSSEPSVGASGSTQQSDSSERRERGGVRRDTPPPVASNKRNWKKKLDESIERADEDSSSGGGSSIAGGADGSSEGESLPPRSRVPLEVSIGDRVHVKYGRGRQLKVYEAKVLRVEDDGPDRRFYVHYTGWNMRYDEWVRKNRIVENVTDKAGRRKRIHKDAPDTPPGGNKRSSASRNGVRRGRPPGSVRGSVPPRPTSAGSSSGTRGRRRSGALEYESGINSDESSQQTAATQQEEELLKTSQEGPEEDMDDRESGSSSPCSMDQADVRDQTSPLPDIVQEEQDTKEEDKMKEEEDEDTDIDEEASVAARPHSADGEEDSRAVDEQETGPEQTMDAGKEEEEDSLSGNLFIYEESSTAEEVDIEKEETQDVTAEEPLVVASVPVAVQVKEEEAIVETPLTEEVVKDEGDSQEDLFSTGTAEQNDEVEDNISLQVPEEIETPDVLNESEVKEDPLICEEVIQEPNAEIDVECKVENIKEEAEEDKKMERTEVVLMKESLPESEATEEVKQEEVCAEPIIEEPLYEEVDEIVEMEGEPMTKTVQEIVESALEALETTETDEVESVAPCQEPCTAAELIQEEVAVEKTEVKEEEEAPTAKVKKKKGPRMKKSKLEAVGEKKLKRQGKKLHTAAQKRHLSRRQGGPFPKRRKMGVRGRQREDAAESNRQGPESVAEPGDFLSTLAEVCSGQGSSFKEQPVAAESADALFLLCEEKVPASPLHSAADLSVPVLENTPPTTPDDSEGTSSEGASPHRSGGNAQGGVSFLDAESTLSAEGDSENSQGLTDLKGEGEDSSSSRTTDSAEVPKKGVKRTASSTTLPDMDEIAVAQADGTCTSPVQTTSQGSKRTRKSVTPRTPSRCEPGMKARQPRSVLKARDMFMGSSLENTEMGLRRPSKFNFDAPLDEDMDPEQRINVLQDRMAELRKVYSALKAEVALIDRRRKRAKKKDSGTSGPPDPCLTPEAHCFS